jgi:hypothetical protein
MKFNDEIKNPNKLQKKFHKGRNQNKKHNDDSNSKSNSKIFSDDDLRIIDNK